MNLFSVLFFGMFLVTGVMYIYMGSYILYVNIREKINRVFAVGTLALSIWALAYAMDVVAQDYSNALFWRRISSIGWSFFYAIMLQFALELFKNSSIAQKKKLKFGSMYFLLYIPSFVTVYVYGISTELSRQYYKLTRTQFGWRYVVQNSIWDYFFDIYYVSYSILFLVLLFFTMKRTKLIREKKQVVLIISSFVVCFLLGSLTDIIFGYFIAIDLPQSAVLFFLIPVIATWYAIRRYGSLTLSIDTISEDILSKMSEGLILMDSNGRIKTVNYSFIKLIGYSIEEIVGKEPNQIFKKSSVVPDVEWTWDGLLNSDTKGIEITLKKRDRSDIPVMLSGTRIMDQWGDLVGAVYIVTDLSEIKSRETELLITKKELEIALHKANIALEAKTQFLSNISHEIRTPMNSIVGMTYLASQTDLTQQQKVYFNQIQKSTNVLLGIVNDVLDFSKIDSGKMELENVEFDLDSIISNTIEKFTDIVEEKQLEMNYYYSGEIPRKIIGDPIRLGQVLSNLIHNAIKFTTFGEINITITKQERSKDRIGLQFSIQDTGIGIDKENQEKIFGVFTQLDGSSTRQFSGTGLGLAIVKKLVEMMGGQISLESQTGKGSTFTFTAFFQVRKEEHTKVIHEKEEKNNRNELDKKKSTFVDIKSEMEVLLSLLLKGDSLAVEKFEELSDRIKEQFSVSDYNYVSSRIQRYEFDQVAERLKEMFF